ncbi:sigma-70 family RNA polymerase sigma factor [Sphingomonas sp. 22176]
MTTASTSNSALDAIFRSDYAWLQSWVKRRTAANHLAEDVAAETMLRLTSIAANQQIREPRAIMTIIARRILYDLRVRNDLHCAYEEAMALLPAALEPSPEEQLIVREALRQIDRVLQRLSMKARSAFLLSQIEGMRQAEIAELLGVSSSMVRKYIAQALRACYLDASDDR